MFYIPTKNGPIKIHKYWMDSEVISKITNPSKIFLYVDRTIICVGGQKS